MKNKLLLLFLLAFLSGCLFQEKIKYINSIPNVNLLDDHIDEHSLIIASSFGLQGQINPISEIVPQEIILRSSGKYPTEMKFGGIESYFGHIKTLKNVSSDHVILLDTGDLFGKNLIKDQQDFIIKAIDQLGFDAISLTESELLYRQLNEEQFKSIKSHFLTSNIIDIKESKQLSENNLLPYKIVEKKGYKIGLISITDFDSIDAKSKSKIKGVYFQDPVHSFIKTRNEIRKNKVDMIILMTHLNSQCVSPITNKAISFDEHKDFQLNCKENDPLLKLVKRLPPNSVDLLLTNHFENLAGFVESLPIVGGQGQGTKLGLLKLKFDEDEKTLNRGDSYLLPFLKMCREVFVSTQDCHIERNDKDVQHGRFKIMEKTNYLLMPTKFLGHEININKIQSIFNTFKDK